MEAESGDDDKDCLTIRRWIETRLVRLTKWMRKSIPMARLCIS